MSGHEELWSRTAAAEFQALDPGRRDLAAALIREICREPYALGVPQNADGPARDRIAVTGDVSVHYQVDDLSEPPLVYLVRVVWRG